MAQAAAAAAVVVEVVVVAVAGSHAEPQGTAAGQHARPPSLYHILRVYVAATGSQ